MSSVGHSSTHSHSPLPEAYDHAYDVVHCFRDIPMGAEVLLQLDRLVTLLETPCFTFLRQGGGTREGGMHGAA